MAFLKIALGICGAAIFVGVPNAYENTLLGHGDLGFLIFAVCTIIAFDFVIYTTDTILKCIKN